VSGVRTAPDQLKDRPDFRLEKLVYQAMQLFTHRAHVLSVRAAKAAGRGLTVNDDPYPSPLTWHHGPRAPVSSTVLVCGGGEQAGAGHAEQRHLCGALVYRLSESCPLFVTVSGPRAK
jgi:hypothetical protein